MKTLSPSADLKDAWVHPKVHLVRYADDFIITGSSQELLENEVRPLVEQFLRDRGLQLSQEKTCITHIQKGSTSSAKTSASTEANCSSSRPRKTPWRSGKGAGNDPANKSDATG